MAPTLFRIEALLCLTYWLTEVARSEIKAPLQAKSTCAAAALDRRHSRSIVGWQLSLRRVENRSAWLSGLSSAPSITSRSPVPQPTTNVATNGNVRRLRRRQRVNATAVLHRRVSLLLRCTQTTVSGRSATGDTQAVLTPKLYCRDGSKAKTETAWRTFG